MVRFFVNSTNSDGSIIVIFIVPISCRFHLHQSSYSSYFICWIRSRGSIYLRERITKWEKSTIKHGRFHSSQNQQISWNFIVRKCVNQRCFKLCNRLMIQAPCLSESYIKVKMNANFYFQTSLWCLKRFDEGL